MPPNPTPHALRDAPALIEAVFPAQKVSFEAQRERKAGPGSYWKGRKPLILVRAIVLGSLLPQTGDAERDLDVFERLMAFDDEGLARRALAANGLKPKDIAARIERLAASVAPCAGRHRAKRTAATQGAASARGRR